MEKELQPNGKWRKQIYVANSLNWKQQFKSKKKQRCVYCHSNENLTIDHKNPKVLGGSSSEKNLQILCQRCNAMKGAIPHKALKTLFKWHIQIIVEKQYRKQQAKHEQKPPN